MIVVDSSAAVSALLNDGPARQAMGDGQLHAPHLIDSEVTHVLRRRVLSRGMAAADGQEILEVFGRLAITRYPAAPLTPRVWELRQNLSAYDATYVALAEALACPLVTADGRLSAAPGLRCLITKVPA